MSVLVQVQHTKAVVKLLKRKLQTVLALAVLSATHLVGTNAAHAQVTTSWTSPAQGSTFQAGVTLDLFGNANSSGLTGGTGLDLALVLDSSGSMATRVSGQSRNLWLRQASVALVTALPQDSTSVTVIDFDSRATTLLALTPLSTGSANVITAINALNAAGGTNIGAGITLATSELNGPNATPGRTQMMVVVSDGSTSGNPSVNTTAAIAAGIDAVHTVGIPGHNTTTMAAIAAAGNGIYTNASDLTGLVSLFNGTSGNLVGIDRIDVQMNDGSFLSNVAFDGLGNFTLNATLSFGANVFVATAYDALGNNASATLMLQAVPEPETYAMLVAGLVAVGVATRRRRTVVKS